MKNRFLNAMLCMAALLLACVWSCEKDDAQVNLETSDETQIILSKKLSLLDISHFNEVNTAISRLSTRLNRKGSRLQKTLDTDSIFIDVEDIIYMTYAQTHTYTFKMIRSNPEYYIENIVLHYNVDTQSYDEYLLQYDLTAEEYVDIANGGDLSDDVITYITNLDIGTLSAALNKNSCTITCQTIVLTCTAGGGHYPGDPECCVTKGKCSADQGGAIFNTCTPSCTYDPPVESIDEGDTSSGGGGGGNGTIATNPNPREVCHQNGVIGISGNDSECLMTVYDNCIANGNSTEVCNCVAESGNLGECEFEEFFEITETVEFQNQTCLKSIKDDVVATGEMSKIVKKFEPTYPVLHLEWGMFTNAEWANTGDTGLNAEQDTSFINLNTESLSHVNNIIMVKTIAHELIHAELYRKLKELVDDYQIISLSEYNALQDNFMGIADYTLRYGRREYSQNIMGDIITWGLFPDFSLAHHNQMADFYRQTLIDVMRAYDTSKGITRTNAEEFYEALSWAGLRITSDENGENSQYTDAWKNFKDQIDIDEADLPESERTYNRYVDIINQEYNGSGINCD